MTSTAMHLLSAEARMVTGQVIAVDGGRSVSEPRAESPAGQADADRGTGTRGGRIA